MPSAFGHASDSSSSWGDEKGASEAEAIDDEVSSKERTHSWKASWLEESEPESEDGVAHGQPVQHEDPPLAEDTEAVGAAQGILRLGKSFSLDFCRCFLCLCF